MSRDVRDKNGNVIGTVTEGNTPKFTDRKTGETCEVKSNGDVVNKYGTVINNIGRQ